MSTEIEELREQCKHVYIRERRAAIMRLAKMMQDPACQGEVKPLLEERANTDKIGNIRILARSILDYFERRNPSPGNTDREHIFAVSCPHCQRICYYDKREEVKKRPLFMTPTPEKPLATLYLYCTHCGKPLTDEVDLEGYA